MLSKYNTYNKNSVIIYFLLFNTSKCILKNTFLLLNLGLLQVLAINSLYSSVQIMVSAAFPRALCGRSSRSRIGWYCSK